MVLTTEYQHVGVSNNLIPNVGNYYYFTEVYAKAIPNETTGIYSVYIKQLITCSLKSSFYQHVTKYSGTINGVEVYSGTNKPWTAWDVLGSTGYPASVISEGSTQVDCSDGLEHEISLTTSFQYLGGWNTYTPAYGATATTDINVTLPAIPRASKISNLSSSNGCLDGTITYTLTPASNALKNRHTVKYNDNTLFSSELGSFSGAQTISVDLSNYLESIYNAVKDTTDVNISVILETCNDTAVIGTESAEKIIKIPENEATRPVIKSVILSPGYYSNVSFGGSYVQGKTLIKKEVTALGQFGASISKYVVTIDGSVYSGGWLNLSGKELKVSVVAKDTRGIPSLPYEVYIDIYEYRAPLIVNHSAETEILCYRCDDNGKQTDTGANAYIKLGKQFSDIPGNVCRVNYRLRGEGESWSEYRSLSSGNAEYSDIISMVFPNPSKAYHIQLQIIDSGNESTTKTFPIAADWVDYQYNGATKSWAFGEPAPTSREKAFSLGLRTFFDRGVEPIAFIKDENLGASDMSVTDDEERALVPISAMLNYTLFIIKLGNTLSNHIGIRTGNIIEIQGYVSHIEIGEGRFYVNIVGEDDISIIDIYGLI